jgi:hypothetical protein
LRETNQVFQLTPCLFNNSILTSQDDTHSTQIANFSPAHDQRVDVKSASCKGTRNTRQDSRFILNKAIKNMSVRGNAGCAALNILAMSHASFFMVRTFCMVANLVVGCYIIYSSRPLRRFVHEQYLLQVMGAGDYVAVACTPRQT